jgi:hypothetical protein
MGIVRSVNFLVSVYHFFGLVKAHLHLQFLSICLTDVPSSEHFITHPLVHIHQKTKIAAEIASVNGPLNGEKSVLIEI